VTAASRAGRPVVTLETSIVSQGLPAPYNLEAARGCEAAIREAGAIPATVAVLDGRLKVGLTAAELVRMATAQDTVKVSVRDLGWAIATGRAGATTVAATVRASRLAGIRFMATGGIGGVHLGHPEDVSADLHELSMSAVAVFCAGAKTVLDIARTLEALESYSVPVYGWQTDDFPGFYIRSTGFTVPALVDAAEAAAVLRGGWAAGLQGAVIGVPPPDELVGAADLVAEALRSATAVVGAAVTPHLLARVAELSGGRSLRLNVDLAINNARVAAETAVAFAKLGAGESSAPTA